MNTLKKFQEQFTLDLLHPKKSSHPKHFSIYHQNWSFGLTKALKNIYPVCERLTGNVFFEAMAKIFVQSHPSTFFSLNEYGKNFDEFIKNFEPAKSLVYLSDVAKLEWIIHETLIAKSNPVFDIGNMISLVDHGKLLKSEYPIDKIWETNQENYEGETNISLDEGPVWLLVFRCHYDLKIESLEKEVWEFLFTFKEK